MKKKNLLIVLAAILLAIVPISLKATHVAGGEITYRCTGGNTYEIELKLYRDCSPGSATLPASLTVHITGSGCPSSTASLSLIPGSGNEITPLCPGVPSPCQSQQSILPIGIQEYIYRGTWTVPNTSCTNWTMAYSLCCRNSSITTGQNDQNFYITSSLQHGGGLTPCNSSPQFDNVPVPVLCVGQEFVYNHGVTDPDGDSLSFSLVPCRLSSTGDVSYDQPLSGSQPLHASVPITVNSQTGTIRITPSIEQIGAVCFRVEEYRNGVKIGEVYRDMTYIVVNCTTMLPSVSGMSHDPGNWTAHFDTLVCPNQPVTFNIYSHISDPNFAKPLCMSWDSGITNATFSVSQGQQPTGCFSYYPTGTFAWTPTQADIGFHYFTITVKDDGCPVAQNIWSYSIEVREPAILLPDTLFACNSSPVLIDSNNASASAQLSQFSWIPQTGVSDPYELFTTIIPQASTTYTLLGTNPHCAAHTTMHIDVTTVDISVQLAGHMLTAQEPGAQYQWLDCDLGFAHIFGDTAQTFQPTITGNYAVIVTKNGCVDTSACHYVLITNVPDADFGAGIRLYPNPTKGTLFVEIEATRAGNYRLQLYNVAGQMVHGVTVAVAEGTTTLQLETAHLAGGLYQVVVEGEDGRRVQQVVVMEP